MINGLRLFFRDASNLYKTINKSKRQLEREKTKSEYKTALLIKWMYLYHYGMTIKDWLDDTDKKTVAVYGMGDLGQLLYYELTDKNVEVLYTVDQNYEYKNSEIQIYPLKDGLEHVDVVIVTLLKPDKGLLKEVHKKTNSSVITLESVIEQLINKIHF